MTNADFEKRKVKQGRIPKRYIISLLAFLGFCNVYMMRVNLSVAIVAMTRNYTVEYDDGTIEYHQDFDWDSGLQGIILSSFFYGYIATQIIGGMLAEKFGGRSLFGIGILSTAIFTLLSPLAALGGTWVFIFLRVLMGLVEGVTYPSMHEFWSRWAPPKEKSRLMTIAFSGSYVGTVFSMILCGLLAESLGWASIFYVFGGIGALWSISWFYFVKEHPDDDDSLSQEEYDILKNIREPQTQEDTSKTSSINKPPWKSIATSLPVWAIIVSHFSENWGFYTLLSDLPTYMYDVLDYDLKSSSFMSALPYIVMAVIVPIGGYIADSLIVKQILSTTNVRKLFTCVAYFGQAIFLMVTAFSSSKEQAIAGLTLAVGFGGFAISGFLVNHQDIAPKYAGTLMGITNCFATIPGMVSPTISGAIVSDKLQSQWQIVFFIAAGFYAFGSIFYMIFGSGEKQTWAEGNIKDNPTNESSPKETS